MSGPHAAWFHSDDEASHAALGAHAGAVVRALAGARAASRPFSGAAPADLAARIAGLDPCPPQGRSFDTVIAELGEHVLAHGVHVSHPACAAHLHCPTLLPAVATELAIAATNQSMDSFDQAPAATLVEDHLVRWLAGTVGLAGGSGVLTSGGTASNLLGLLLARQRAVAQRPATDTGGLPPEAAGWRIVTSAHAHDSVARGAMLLGLGAGAVVAVTCDARGRMDPAALRAALADLGGRAIAVVATAGTTDLGAIDPLPEIADAAGAAGAWLHVDAAVGSGLALSPRLAPLLAGIERADSVTADLHKLWFQPIGASALLVRDVGLLAAAHHHSDYLNRPEDEAAGVLNLVGRSLDTSRRFDALKILAGLRTAGRERMAAMVEHLVDLAAAAGAAVDAHPALELLAPPQTVTVVFRVRGDDATNVAAQRALLATGEAIVGRTRLDGRVALKLTFVNPLARERDVRAVLDAVVAQARAAA